MSSTDIGTSFQFSVGCNGSVVPLVTSVDRLLRYFLGQFIRRGTMTFTAASGTRFTCGDGTGRPVSVRFLSPQTERRILLNPELALGEAYMDGVGDLARSARFGAAMGPAALVAALPGDRNCKPSDLRYRDFAAA